MKEELTVSMTAECLFDFLLYHTYSKFAGFLSNVLGLAIAFMGIIMLATGHTTPLRFIFYLIAAVLFLIYTPFSLKIRAKNQMKANPEFMNASDYIFDDQGIRVTQKDQQEKQYSWDQIEKVVATPKNIGIYYGVNDALIIPKESFGDKFMPIMRIITAYVSREKVKIR